MKFHAGHLAAALWVTSGFGACAPAGHGGQDTASDTDRQPRRLLTFTTSVAYDRDLKAAGEAASGLEGADALCLRHAQAAGLPGVWHAWLSDTQTDAVDHIVGDGPWDRSDGEVAFLNRASLAGVPIVALNVDEYGRPAAQGCSWTNTHIGGRRSADCRWEGDAIDDGCAHEVAGPESPRVIAAVGSPGSAGGDWTDIDATGPFIGWSNCSLYCLQAP